MTTEWRSILGDKYCHALPFDYVITDNMEEASVIAWDGVISLKQKRNVPEIEAQLKKGKVLLMIGESQTYKNVSNNAAPKQHLNHNCDQNLRE